MFRRRKASAATEELRRAWAGFRALEAKVEEAKATLLLGIPSGRRPQLPLAEALAGFELGLREASSEMGGWRLPEVESEWVACQTAVGLTLERAERLRLEVPTDAYEELVPWLDEVLEPLEAFGRAAARFSSLRA
jgi:hypothetical protein